MKVYVVYQNYYDEYEEVCIISTDKDLAERFVKRWNGKKDRYGKLIVLEAREEEITSDYAIVENGVWGTMKGEE